MQEEENWRMWNIRDGKRRKGNDRDREMKDTERWMMMRKRRKSKNEIVGTGGEKEGRTGKTDGQVIEMVPRQNFLTGSDQLRLS